MGARQALAPKLVPRIGVLAPVRRGEIVEERVDFGAVGDAVHADQRSQRPVWSAVSLHR